MSSVAHHSVHRVVHRVAPSIIAANAAIVAAAYLELAPEHVLSMAETSCLAFFGVEMAVAMYAEGRAFWRSRWNLFDLTVTVLAALPMLLMGMDLGILRVARVARVARLLHLGRHISGLRLLPQLVRLAALAHWRLKFGDTATLRIQL